MFGTTHTFVYLRLLLDGVAMTLALGLTTIVLGGIISVACGTARTTSIRWLTVPLAWYVEVIRSIPLLVLLFLGFYGLPILFHLNTLPPFVSAVVVMAIYHGAYGSEVVRAGIEAVPRGQWDAARALGFEYPTTMRWIIAPQALRVVIPPAVSQWIGTFKDTSLASVIGLMDLTNVALLIRQDSFSNWDVLGVLAGLYFAINVQVALLGALIERRLARSDRPMAGRAKGRDGRPLPGEALPRSNPADAR